MNRRLFPAGFSACVALLASVAIAQADGTVLYEKTSAYNTIVVTEEDGLRILRFGRGGARQSAVKLGKPEYLALPYAAVALTGLALPEETRRFLVVGLGGGTLPMFLRKYYPEATIDAVDIDPDVVDVARKFFGFREDRLMHAHVADGRQFIERSRQPYDVIFLDAFGANSIPARLATQEFLHAVRRAVTPGGVVVGNLWDRSANPLYDSMVRTYQEVFDELLVLKVHGAANRILLALPRKQPLGRVELMQRARKVSAARRLPFNLGDPVQYGFLGAPQKTQRGRVLRDRGGDRSEAASQAVLCSSRAPKRSWSRPVADTADRLAAGAAPATAFFSAAAALDTGVPAAGFLAFAHSATRSPAWSIRYFAACGSCVRQSK